MCNPFLVIAKRMDGFSFLLSQKSKQISPSRHASLSHKGKTIGSFHSCSVSNRYRFLRHFPENIIVSDNDCLFQVLQHALK